MRPPAGAGAGSRVATTILVVLTLLPITLLPGAAATHGFVATRDASYPPGVANITHEPWNPAHGGTVTVTLRLDANATRPDGVSLLWCRVEPDYVCALPAFMRETAAGAWSAKIPGAHEGASEVIRKETVHIGYNVTLRHGTGSAVERVSAPTANHWIPDTYPIDADGHYYFLAYRDAPRMIDAAGILSVTLAVLAGLAMLRLAGEPGVGGRRRHS